MFADWVYMYPRRALVVTGAVLVVLAGLIWWNFILQSPARAFQDMLHNNLSVTGFTKHQQLTVNGQTIDQSIRVQQGSVNATDSLVVSAQGTVETIVTPTANYFRYVNITQPASVGPNPHKFDAILNVWGKSLASSNTTLSQQYSQSFLDLSTAPMPPIGNLSAKQRGVIVRYINKNQVLVPNYKTLKRTSLNGRRVFVYQVSVKLAPYLLVMQAFAKNIGLHDLDTIDVTQYLQSKPVAMEFTVDSVSHQLVRASYPTAKYSETYDDYGLVSGITIPAKTIPLATLQAQLQKLE